MSHARTLPEGPALAAVMHRIAQAPPDLFDPAASAPALAADTVRLLTEAGDVAGVPGGTGAAGLPEGPFGHVERDDWPLLGLTCWLWRDPELRAAGLWEAVTAVTTAGQGTADPTGVENSVAGCLAGRLGAFVAAIAGERLARDWVTVPEAREEAARAFLRVGGVLPAGESAAVAEDRWNAVSTKIQRRIASELAQEARRAERLARELTEQRAREAAAQYANY